MTYEVHISHKVGVIDEPHDLKVVIDDHTFGMRRDPGSLFMRTPDRDLAERVASVHEATARRSDDRHAWIREVEA